MSMLRKMAHPALSATYARGCSVLARLQLRAPDAPRHFGRVRIVAPLQRGNGIAAGAVLQHRALSALGIDVALVDATPALRNPLRRVSHDAGDVYIFHCGGPQTPNLLNAVMPYAARAWRIAYWAWELPDPPRDWHGFDALVSEVWTPSNFARSSLSMLARKPVRVVPHRVEVQPPRHRDWNAPFTVLTLADSRSSLARKNPAGALEAFIAAFGGSTSARLVVKLNGPAVDEALVRRAGAFPNVTLLHDHLDQAALAALYRSADALLSLHRAEGFGLPMLEAMAYGLPVVATGWSGNMEFMSGANGILVPYRLVPVADPAGIYADSIWAEPDVDAAATALLRLAADRQHYEERAAAAHAAVAEAPVRLPFDFRHPGPLRTAPPVTPASGAGAGPLANQPADKQAAAEEELT